MNCFKICQDSWFVWSILTNCFSMTVCSCHVTYPFRSESTPYSCLNVKELLARSSYEIWSLSYCNGIRTQNHLVHRPVWSDGWVFIYELSGSGFESSCFSMLLQGKYPKNNKKLNSWCNLVSQKATISFVSEFIERSENWKKTRKPYH